MVTVRERSSRCSASLHTAAVVSNERAGRAPTVSTCKGPVTVKSRVVVFTAYGGEERIASAIGRGADSYVLKGTSSDELVAAVRAAAAGESLLTADVASQLVRGMRAPRTVRLTEREREILVLVADGMANKAIGARLGITERTVKYHVTEILGRLGADNRAQAVAIANRRGLLP